MGNEIRIPKGNSIDDRAAPANLAVRLDRSTKLCLPIMTTKDNLGRSKLICQLFHVIGGSV